MLKVEVLSRKYGDSLTLKCTSIFTTERMGSRVKMKVWAQHLPRNYSVPSIFSLVSRHQRSLSSLSREDGKCIDYTRIHKCSNELAFGFDIDGVLLRGTNPVPGASKTLKFLQDSKIPFVLLTNGGGKTEGERAAELSAILDVPILKEDLIQSHTPFKELVNGTSTQEALKNKMVLVLGSSGEKCREIAMEYGFGRILTAEDILMGYSDIWPLSKAINCYEKTHCSLPFQINLEDLSKSLKVDAILVLDNPRDWALVIQIILDLLLSHKGYLGTYSSMNSNPQLPNCGWQQDDQPALYFSNPDLFWASNCDLPRLGQGGFQAAFEGVWKATTRDAQLSCTTLGKPCDLAFSYAERVLLLNRPLRLGLDAPDLKTVWFVGDNQLTDIKGANQFESPLGIEWKSILVMTGIHKSNSSIEYTPNLIASDVQEAVKYVIDARLNSI
ncbi:hypothetical protein HI914_01040 [Erysiphe necator]|nr:hypothetical protein HI914_01040 [Erysiphe necator]